MAAIPYFEVSQLPGLPRHLQPYGLLLLTGATLGVLAAWRVAKRRGIAGNDVALLIAAVPAAFVLAHVFDVVFNQWERASLPLLLRVFDGQSLMGALMGVALVVLLVTAGGKRDLASYADVAAVGTLVAMTIGRIGCTLVHDHLGRPTSLPIGIDVPAERARWVLPEVDGGTVRLHDLGFEELLVLLPLTVLAYVLGRRPLRAGMVAAIAALIYAPVRFGLDFLRFEHTDPRHLGFTGAQWGCVAIAVIAIVALARIRSAHVGMISQRNAAE